MRSLIGRFFGWWCGELRVFVPAPLRRLFSPSPAILNVGLDGRTVSFHFVQNNKVRKLGKIERPETDAAKKINAEIRRVLRRVNLGQTVVNLRLPRDQALQKTITLPLAAEENLKDVLEFEMDRVTPFRAADVYFGHRVLNRDPDQQKLETAVTVMPRQTVDEALELATSWGLKPDSLDVGGPEEGSAPEMNLLPERQISASARVAQLFTAVLLMAAVGLAALAIMIPLGQKEQQAERLLAAVKRERANAEAVMEFRRQIDLTIRDSYFLTDQKSRSPARIEILNELSRLLPDGTWLQRLKISGDAVDISGFSPKSAELLGLLESSDRLEGAAFRSPVTQDPRTGLERFNLEVRIVARAKVK
jgi:general secretion pathway protein L